MKNTALIALIALVSFAASAVDLSNIDADQDGKISKEEASTHPMLKEQFADLDTNGDGFITKDELKNG
ncbi:calmodulin [Aestuariibacter sp. AA17]|uniref:Calmodulin n=1 Tax=Fluctibacter corallii TaxID=2984329 RepID=A0ABT3A5W5_9ALTE|nr:calmodulin [Aestuariibacter sp. AA17]MCV2884015.1 calmodulin [Aestuariibacter sp. AA17]